MADALNRSHLDKFSELRLSFKNAELLVSAYSDKDTWLEDWTFKKKAGFFTDVFGVNVRLEKESGEIDGFI
jgi:exopolyphosphatase/guanosine-5'-triphosphate,3'-diphosphate pyrophosphatase